MPTVGMPARAAHREGVLRRSRPGPEVYSTLNDAERVPLRSPAEQVTWIVGKIVGAQDPAEVGVWVTNELDEANPGLIFAANSGATKYSDWGADLGEPIGGDGWVEVRDCL